MIAVAKKEIDFKKYISFVLIAYAFSFPLSKAATNLFEMLAILLWIIEGNWREKWQLYKTNLLSIAIFSLIGFSLLSILWHGNTETTLRYIAKYRHLLVIFVFYSSFDTKYTKTLLSAFLSAMFISELMSYAIFFELIHYKNISPLDPTPFMSHMTYSTVLAFTSSILLIEFFHSQHIKAKFIYGIFFLTVTTNLFINGGRTGQVIFIILILILFLRHITNKLKAIILVLSMLSFIFITAYNFSPNFKVRSIQLRNDISAVINHNNYNGSAGARIALNVIALNNFKDNLLFGTGINNDMKQIQKYLIEHNLDLKNIQKFGDAHNAFATIATQLGIIGFVITIALIYSLFTFNYINIFYKDLSLMFAVSFCLFSLTHNTLHTMNPMVFFALFAGYFNAIARHKQTNTKDQ